MPRGCSGGGLQLMVLIFAAPVRWGLVVAVVRGQQAEVVSTGGIQQIHHRLRTQKLRSNANIIL